MRKNYLLLAFFSLAFSSHAFAQGQAISPIAMSLLIFAVFVGIIVSVILYRAAHAKKALDFEPKETQKTEKVASRVPSVVREKLRKLPLRVEDTDGTVEELSKIIEEETEHQLRNIKQEFAVKLQVLEQQKSQEMSVVHKDYSAIKEKYEEANTKYHRSEDEKKTTEAVVRSIADGIVVVNQKGEVLLMNPSAEKLLGIQKERKIGKPILDNLHDELMISMTREAGDLGEKVVEFKGKDENSRRILRSSSAVIQNENGQTVGMVNILTDVTKQRELDEIKTKFISNITHELRTPIVAIQKAIAILETDSAGPLSETQKNFLGIVARNLTHLSRLVEDLLDMAKIEAGKMHVRMAPVRLSRIVSEACDSLSTWARSKDIQIIRDIDKNMPEMTLDFDKITQVMNNLIGNAIKFTRVGGKITVRSVWHVPTNEAEVSVIDTGVGIAKENMPKLFGRFEQFGDQQGISGTGLGLSISKEIVEKHGGRIFAESGKGSKFTFILPIRHQKQP